MPKPRNKTRKIIVFSLIGVVIAALATVAAVRKREVVIEIQTDKVSRRNITEVVVANGRIQPVVQVVINPEVSGEIIELPVKEGQNVKKGDLLLKIKPDNYIAQRNSMEANHLSSLANMTLAKANMDKAELEYARVKRLGNQVVSESDFLTAKTSFDVAKASYETATHQAAQAAASLARATDDLSKTTISPPSTAPFANSASNLANASSAPP
jgi:HlyD family secretion protein